MIHYTPNPDNPVGMYGLSWIELREHYARIIAMSDDEFMLSLPEVLHFATYICWIKEIPSQICLADNGLIHMLIHLLNDKDGRMRQETLQDVRKAFKQATKLAP